MLVSHLVILEIRSDNQGIEITILFLFKNKQFPISTMQLVIVFVGLILSLIYET